MSDSWKRTIATDNTGKPLTVWTWRDYELALEVNEGGEKGWVFELTECRRRVGLFTDLDEGKRAAENREAGLLDSSVVFAASMDVGP